MSPNPRLATTPSPNPFPAGESLALLRRCPPHNPSNETIANVIPSFHPSFHDHTMSSQGSSNQASLQVDVGNIPNNAVSVIRGTRPFTPPDNVSPLAVVQVEALGACFRLNGEWAGKIPDLLCRNASYRLERLSLSIGWRRNDTEIRMAKTAGGRAASILSLAIMELYKEEPGGALLYQLSKSLLPVEMNQSTGPLLSQVAGTLSRKLAALGFGNHLAFQVTRIREAYFNAGTEVPNDLLFFPTVQTMTEFLQCLSTALQEEHSMLYFQGCKGVGHMLAIVMALCPDDTFVTVENEVIFQGERRSVVFDIQSVSATQFSIESILYTDGKVRNPIIVSVETSRKLQHSAISLKWDGYLSDALDLALADVGARFTIPVRISCVELISAIICSVSGRDMCQTPYGDPLPTDGFRGVLGPDGLNRVRETLKRIFLCEPSFTILQCDEAYNNLCVALANAVPSNSCECNRCFKDGRFTNHCWGPGSLRTTKCKVHELWVAIDWFILRGIAASFVRAGENTCMPLQWVSKGSLRRSPILHRIRHVLTRTGLHRKSNVFGVRQLHLSVMGVISKPTTRTIGISSRACSIFPTTIQNPLFESPLRLEYIIVDGLFHDEHNYYRVITSDQCPNPPRIALQSISGSPIVQSSLGVHTQMTLTARPVGEQLHVETTVQMSTQTVSLNFYKQHVGYMGVNIATKCGHNTRKSLSQSSVPVITTSVSAPVVYPKLQYDRDADHNKTRKEVRNLSQIGMALTHNNAEAQFLACELGAPTLFQGESCLDCAVKEAYELGMELVIQS